MIRISLQNFATFKQLVAVGLVAAGAAMAGSVHAQESSVSLDLNDDAVRLTWQQFRPARQLSYEASAFNHQDRGTVVALGLHITGNAATKARPITAGLGGRLVYGTADDIGFGGVDIPGLDRDGYALAVGGFFKGQVPNYDRIGFGGHLYYAPDVISFGDMEEFADGWLYGSYSVLRNGDIYVGARVLKADYKDGGDHNFDTGLHMGFTLKF